MHKSKVIIGTVLVVGVFCAIYVWMQPAHKPPPAAPEQRLAQKVTERVAPTTATSQASVIHSGERVWAQVRDEKTGKVA